MFRRRNTILVLLLAVSAGIGGPLTDSAIGDDVARYLADHELDELLAVHLEDRIEVVSDDERPELLLRLAAIYARLLESEGDAVRRADLERRGHSLLRIQPQFRRLYFHVAWRHASYSSAYR